MNVAEMVEAKRKMQSYYNAHRFCPECKGIRHTTHVSIWYEYTDPALHKDLNEIVVGKVLHMIWWRMK